jgi:hypothetical protein
VPSVSFVGRAEEQGTRRADRPLDHLQGAGLSGRLLRLLSSILDFGLVLRRYAMLLC